jgi:hypothetical protein
MKMSKKKETVKRLGKREREKREKDGGLPQF